MTVSPIRFGQNTAIFMVANPCSRRCAPGPLPFGPIHHGSQEILFERLVPNSGGQEPGQDIFHDIAPRRQFEPDSQRSQRGWPKQAGAKLDQILLSGQDEIGADLGRPAFQRANILGRIRVMIGEHAQIAQLMAQAEQGSPKSLRIADSAKRRDRLSLLSALAEK